MNEHVEQLKALADFTRLRMIRLFWETREKLCVCEIMDALEVSHSNVSRHLKILKTAGFVEEKKDGRWVYFFLADSGSPFHKNILLAVGTMPAGLFATDMDRLQLRVSLRENGKCVDGVKSGKWTAMLEHISCGTKNRYNEQPMEYDG